MSRTSLCCSGVNEWKARWARWPSHTAYKSVLCSYNLFVTSQYDYFIILQNNLAVTTLKYLFIPYEDSIFDTFQDFTFDIFLLTLQNT